MMSPTEAGEFFVAHFTKEAFRLETLDYYNVESDGDDHERYAQGKPGPDMARLSSTSCAPSVRRASYATASTS